MIVSIVSGVCGDYYCGCGLAHLLGVFSSEEAADEAVEHAFQMRNKYGESLSETFPHGVTVTRVELDELPPLINEGGWKG